MNLHSTASKPLAESNYSETESISNATSTKSLNVNSSTSIFDYLKKTSTVVKYRLLYCLAKIAKFFSYIFFLPQETRDNLDKHCEEYLNKITAMQGKINNSGAVYKPNKDTDNSIVDLILEAIRDKNPNEVERLLQTGFNISTMIIFLLEAIKSQETDTVGLLLQYDILCNATFNNEKSKVFTFAKSFPNKEIVELLEIYSLPAHIRVNSSIRGNKCIALKFLLNKDNVNIANTEGNTPIFDTQNIDTLKLILNAGADVNVVNNNGETPVFSFMNKNRIDLVIELLKIHPDLNIKNNKGESLLNVPYQAENKDLFLTLYQTILQQTNKEFTQDEKNKFLDIVSDKSVKDIINELANGLPIKRFLTPFFYRDLVFSLFEEKDENTDLDDSLAKIELFKNWLDIDLGLAIKDGQTILHQIGYMPLKANILKEYITHLKPEDINKKDLLGKTALDYAVNYSIEEDTVNYDSLNIDITSEKHRQILKDANKNIIDILKSHGAIESK